ncbi:MAG: response regulator [Bdellovibrionales bacterium]
MKTLMRKPKILAVDDQPANLIALEAVLSREYELVLAHSGAEAVSIAKVRKDIAVILMDLQMPEMDGFEAAQKIKQIEGCEEIPIIFITAIYKEEPFVRRGYQVGGVDYFSKPFDPEILRMKVGIYAAFRERSEVLKERERQLRETEELLRAGRKLASVLEDLPVGVLIADIDGRICQTNQVMSRICRAIEPSSVDSYGEVLGWWDSKGRLIRDENTPLAQALHLGKVSHNQIMQIHCSDGDPTTVLCSASPLHGMDGNIVGAVVVIQDVTESKKIENDLEEKITRFVSLGIELEQSAH